MQYILEDEKDNLFPSEKYPGSVRVFNEIASVLKKSDLCVNSAKRLLHYCALNIDKGALLKEVGIAKLMGGDDY